MLEALISSKTRIKLLMKFFLNSETRAYLRGLEQEFSESSNAIRVELNRLEGAGMLDSEVQGNKKFFSANTKHPLFNEVRGLLLKHVGIDKIIEDVIDKLGEVDEVYLAGSFAQGVDSPIIDLLVIGNVDASYLYRLCDKVGKMIHRKIRTVVYSREEFEKLDRNSLPSQVLLLWSQKDI